VIKMRTVGELLIERQKKEIFSHLMGMAPIQLLHTGHWNGYRALEWLQGTGMVTG
jgi:hypothetical protein